MARRLALSLFGTLQRPPLDIFEDAIVPLDPLTPQIVQDHSWVYLFYPMSDLKTATVVATTRGDLLDSFSGRQVIDRDRRQQLWQGAPLTENEVYALCDKMDTDIPHTTFLIKVPEGDNILRLREPGR